MIWSAYIWIVSLFTSLQTQGINQMDLLKVSVTVRGVGMFMRLFEKSYKV